MSANITHASTVKSPRVSTRDGMTFAEMLIAMTIMSFITLAVASVSMSVHSTSDYTTDRSNALQHARVTLERIERVVQESYAAETHPGAVVVYDTIGSYRYPDTLLVWHPTGGTPVNPAGPPLIKEVLIYTPDPANYNQLVEMWSPNDTRTIPFDSATLNTTAWRSTLATLKSASSTQKVVLTDLLRIANPTGQTTRRGAIRFDAVVNPSTSEVASFRSGTTTWKNLPWPTVMYGKTYGLRQLRVRTEMQLVADMNQGKVDNSGLLAMPFFGSTATYQRLTP